MRETSASQYVSRIKFPGSRLAGELLLEGSESLDIAEGCLLNRGGDHRSLLLAGTIGALAALAGRLGTFGLVGILEDAAMAEDDTLGILVELNHLEVKLLVDLGLRAILLDKVFGSCEALNTVRKLNDSTLVEHLDDCALVD